MSAEIEAKLDVLAAMNASLGKITNLKIRLTLAGQDDLARDTDTKRKALLEEIEILQGQVAEEWTVEAGTIEEKLRDANRKVQTRIRSIRKKVEVANNAIEILGQIDEALEFLKTVAKKVA